MSITQYSKIQHRRGLSVDLPQLNTSELGHVLDERRLFIGNGDIIEGAPIAGNTEIITEFSLLANPDALKYQYGGGVVDTSVLAVRSVSHVLDERVSVKSFGAIGDGITDDTAAINNALENIYTYVPVSPNAEEMAYKTLYFPAGVYSISSAIFLAPFTTIIGDGIGKTVIRMSDASYAGGFVKTADSLFQTDVNIGTNGAALPSNISVFGISFEHSGDNDILHLDRASNVVFDFCSFDIDDSVTSTISVAVYPDTIGNVATVENVSFSNCRFKNVFKAFHIDDMNGMNTKTVQFKNSTFLNLSVGIFTDTICSDFKIDSCLFDSVLGSAIVAATRSEMFSSLNNTFSGCGNGIDPIIDFKFDLSDEAKVCSSIGDKFTPDCVGLRINTKGTDVVILNNEGDKVFQNVKTSALKPVINLNAGATNINAGVVLLDLNTENTKFIDYSLFCGSEVRIGRLSIVSNGTLSGTVLTDGYSESTLLGIDFNFLIVGNLVELYYSNSSVNSAQLHIQTKSWLA